MRDVKFNCISHRTRVTVDISSTRFKQNSSYHYAGNTPHKLIQFTVQCSRLVIRPASAGCLMIDIFTTIARTREEKDQRTSRLAR